MAKVCDNCNRLGIPAFDTTTVNSRTIPGTGGKAGKAKSERINAYRLGELCVDCADRYDLAIGNLISSFKVGETPLPELGSNESVAPPQDTQDASEGSQEHQESLPLGGDDSDSGPDAIISETNIPPAEDNFTDEQKRRTLEHEFGHVFTPPEGIEVDVIGNKSGQPVTAPGEAAHRDEDFTGRDTASSHPRKRDRKTAG